MDSDSLRATLEINEVIWRNPEKFEIARGNKKGKNKNNKKIANKNNIDGFGLSQFAFGEDGEKGGNILVRKNQNFECKLGEVLAENARFPFSPFFYTKRIFAHFCFLEKTNLRMHRTFTWKRSRK